VVKNLNRKARLEQLEFFLKPKDYFEFKKNANLEDLDDFHLQKAVSIMVKNGLHKYSRQMGTADFWMPFLDPTTKENYFHEDIICYLAYDTETEKAIGYSSWSWTKQLEEHNIAQQVYVLPEYRRQGVATQLLKIHEPNIKAIFADTVNATGKRIYEKSFDMSKVIYGRIHPERNNAWIAANGKEFIKQVKIYEPNYEDFFELTPESLWEQLDQQGMLMFDELKRFIDRK
jgi:GNAT superfamily N-acetyltransferase